MRKLDCCKCIRHPTEVLAQTKKNCTFLRKDKPSSTPVVCKNMPCLNGYSCLELTHYDLRNVWIPKVLLKIVYISYCIIAISSSEKGFLMKKEDFFFFAI